MTSIQKIFGAAAVAVAATAGTAQAGLLYATNGTVLTRFDSANPASITAVPITGLQVGETLVGIDVRPNPTSPGVQSLYGVGSSSRLYVISPLLGTATQVGLIGSFTLNGTSFGTDFNPAVDRIRQVSNTEQNLRLNPNDGTLTATDTALNPAGNIVATAYDRNGPRVPGAPAPGQFTIGTPTTLYGIDSAAGTLVTIGGINGTPSPNLGGITTVGSLGLGTNLPETIGFDVEGGSEIAFATITVGGQSRLYTINLSTGAATNQGAIGLGTTPFVGLAAAAAPEPGAAVALGLAAAGAALRRRRRRARNA